MIEVEKKHHAILVLVTLLVILIPAGFLSGYLTGGIESARTIDDLNRKLVEVSGRLGNAERSAKDATDQNWELERTLASRIDIDRRAKDFVAEAKRILGEIATGYSGKPEEVRKIARTLIELKKILTVE